MPSFDLASNISNVGPTAPFIAGSRTPPAYVGPHVGLTDGVSKLTASKNMAEIYNRVNLQIASAIAESGLVYDAANWAQLGDVVAKLTADSATALAASATISTDVGNTLSRHADGLYVGAVAPADVLELYVDAVNGLDTNTGTRASPLKTIRYAASLGPAHVNRSLALYETQTHYVDPAGAAVLRGGNWTIHPYGPVCDATPNPVGGTKYATAPIVNLNTTIASRKYSIQALESDGRTQYQNGVAMFPADNAAITIFGIVMICGVPTAAISPITNLPYPLSWYICSFVQPGEGGSWYLYGCSVHMPHAVSKFYGGPGSSPLTISIIATTFVGPGMFAEPNTLLTINFIGGGVNAPAGFMANFVPLATVVTSNYAPLKINIQP